MSDATPTAANRSRSSRVLLSTVSVLALAAAAPTVPGAQAQSAAAQYNVPSATGTATTGALRVDFASFGAIDADVRRDVDDALRQGGLQFRYVSVGERRLQRFLDSSLGKDLSSDGPEAIGRASGINLVKNGVRGEQVFRALFPREGPFRPFVATVLSRNEDVSDTQAKFVRGVGAGFGASDVPAVYVERSDDKTSHLSEFRNIPGVETIDNIDTQAGKRRLVALLIRGAVARNAPATATSPTLDAQTSAALVEAADGSSSPAGPIALIVAILGGIAFAAGGIFRRRTSR